MEKRKTTFEKKYILAIALLGLMVILLGSASICSGQTTTFTAAATTFGSTSSSTPQYFNPSVTNPFGAAYEQFLSGAAARGNISAVGEEFYDLDLMIPPAGCQPLIVRSDLLEEQNVPVFCELIALKINPGVDITRIDRVSFAQQGNASSYIAGIGFHPAYAAISSRSSLSGMPMNGVVGYVVVVLKKQPNEKLMPTNVTALLSAVIDYGTENPLGIGPNEFFVPETTAEEFDNNYKNYGFLNGLGYLRVENLDDNGATIAIYTSDEKKIWSSRIEKGKVSRDIYLSGFTGGRGVRIELKGITIAEKKAKFIINNQEQEVYQGQKFADDKCTLSSITTYGAGAGKVTISCGTKPYTLEKKFNQIELLVSDKREQKNIGDSVMLSDGGAAQEYYIVYLGNKPATETGAGKSFIILARNVNNNLMTSTDIVSITKKIDKTLGGVKSNAAEFENRLTDLISSHKDKVELQPVVEGNATAFKGLKFSGPQGFDKGFANAETGEYYKRATNAYEEVINKFATQPHAVTDNPSYEAGQPYGADSLWGEYNLAKLLGQFGDAQVLLSRLENEYPSSRNYDQNSKDNLKQASAILSQQKLFSGEGSSVYDSTNNLNIELESVSEPSSGESGVDLSCYMASSTGGTANRQDLFGVNEGAVICESPDFSKVVSLASFTEDRVTVSCSYAAQAATPGVASASGRVGEQIVLTQCNAKVIVNKITKKKVAQIRVMPITYGKSRESNFTFSIGIEKRNLAMNLTPEEANKKIAELDKKIGDLRNITSVLNQTIRAGKLACLGTSAALNILNLFSGFTGEAAARNQVMTMPGGWNAICAEMAAHREKGYTSDDECVRGESSQIEKDVSAYQTAMSDYNNLESGLRTTSIDQKNRLNSTLLHQNVVNSLQTGGSLSSLTSKLTPEQQSTINSKSFADFSGITDTSELIKNLEIANNPDVSDKLRQGAKDSVTKSLDRVSEETATNDRAKELSSGLNNLPISVPANSKSTRAPYEGLIWDKTTKEAYKLNADTTVDKDLEGKPFAVVPSADKTLGYSYLVSLTSSGDQRTIQREGIYKLTQQKDATTGATSGKVAKVAAGEKTPGLDQNMIFDVYNDASYKNICEKDCDKIYVFTLEPYKGMPSQFPFDFKEGWYVEMKSLMPYGNSIKTYYDSGQISTFYLCNVGKNRRLEGIGKGDDICKRFDLSTGDTLDAFPGLKPDAAKRKVAEAMNWISEAQRQLAANPSTKTVTINQRVLTVVGRSSIDDGSKCTDFMPAKQCQMLFNVCDPFVCPSSRCNLGGDYYVDDVIGSGIGGSLFLCLPNFIGFKGGDVVVPFCITGLHAGLEGWISMLEAYKDCINVSVTGNATIGICDEIESVYMCDFFWKQVGPFLASFTKNIFSGYLFGAGSRGGGEYKFADTAFSNAEKSWQYFQSNYAANSKLAFGARSLSQIGADFCKAQMSATYPDMFDVLLEPESPTQITAWFDEMPYTSATVPPRSQYKVFYHIYAGGDQAVQYRVYLKSSGTALGYTGGKEISEVPEASGYIEKGGRATATKDYVDYSGFKELCVEVNGKPNCGFKRVSTSFALNYAKDKSLEQQATAQVTSEKDCISGTASFNSMLTLNLQSAAQDLMTPQLYNYGIIRVCSSDNPGKSVEPTRWKEVGYCDDTGIKCWVDENSVKNAIQGAGLENSTIQQINSMSEQQLLGTSGYLTQTDASSAINELRSNYLAFAEKPDKTGLDGLDSAVTDLDKKVVLSWQRAMLLFAKAEVYAAATNAFSKIGGTAQAPAAGGPIVPIAKVIENPCKTEDSCLRCMAYAEAGGSIAGGQKIPVKCTQIIMSTIQNRVNKLQFGSLSNVCSVVSSSGQYSAFSSPKYFECCANPLKVLSDNSIPAAPTSPLTTADSFVNFGYENELKGSFKDVNAPSDCYFLGSTTPIFSFFKAV